MICKCGKPGLDGAKNCNSNECAVEQLKYCTVKNCFRPIQQVFQCQHHWDKFTKSNLWFKEFLAKNAK